MNRRPQMPPGYPYPLPPQKPPFKARAGKAIKNFIVSVSLMGMVSLVFWGLITSGSKPPKSPQAGLNPTPSPLSYEKLAQATQAKITPSITPTPAPKFELTAQFLIDQEMELNRTVAAHNSAYQTQVAQIENERELIKLNNEQENHNLGVIQKMDEINFQRDKNAQEYNAQSAILENQIETEKNINELRLKAEKARLDIVTMIILTFGGGITFLVLTLAGAGTVAVIKNYQAENAPVNPDIRLEVIDNQGKRSRFADLPIKIDKFNRWATAAVQGENLGYKYWVENGDFSRPEYDQLTAFLLATGIVRNKYGQSNQGIELTEPGKRSLKNHLGINGNDQKETERRFIYTETNP